MILQALHDLALREGLMEDPDYEQKSVAWLIRVDPNGMFLGFTGTRYLTDEEKKKKKPKLVARSFKVPRESARTSGDRAFFLFDKSVPVRAAPS